MPSSRRNIIASCAMSLVILSSVGDIFLDAPSLILAGSAALVVYFMLCWRQFTGAAWMTMSLCVGLLVLVLIGGISADALLGGMSRMLFLAALLAVMGFLRTAASSDPQITLAGHYLTGQPPGRRYFALSFGGQFLGMLINFGGLAILLEMTKQSIKVQRGRLSDNILEWRLRRMTTASLRGFSLLPFWSPIGVGVNALLLAMPGLRYVDLIAGGLAGCALLTLWGWLLDRRTAPKTPLPAAGPPQSAAPLLTLVAHILLLGLSIAVVKTISGAPFQSALLISIPLYSIAWAIWAQRPLSRPRHAAGRVLTTSFHRFPFAAAEIGVFASAGLLSVLALQIVPTDAVQSTLLILKEPWLLIVALNVTVFFLATIGVNPIITASVLATLVAQADIPGLGNVPVALALAGAWSTVMGFTPAVTTVAFAGAIIDRPARLVGLRWNGVYCLSAFALWTAIIAAWVAFTS
ncbi:MAG: hypothetical protein Q4G49_10040 [Paracoccus sp. (in: a-proteobacteria)]|nr:hypothetical protein [Paracoccus sp. (in: a-proteobacteria)]